MNRKPHRPKAQKNWIWEGKILGPTQGSYRENETSSDIREWKDSVDSRTQPAKEPH